MLVTLGVQAGLLGLDRLKKASTRENMTTRDDPKVLIATLYLCR